MFSNLFKCGNLYSPTIVQINLGSVLPCEKQRPSWEDFTEIFGASVHQCRYREFRTRPTHKDWVSIKFNKESKKMCHLHNEFIYQFVECPNCKSNLFQTTISASFAAYYSYRVQNLRGQVRITIRKLKGILDLTDISRATKMKKEAP